MLITVIITLLVIVGVVAFMATPVVRVKNVGGEKT